MLKFKINLFIFVAEEIPRSNYKNYKNIIRYKPGGGNENKTRKRKNFKRFN